LRWQGVQYLATQGNLHQDGSEVIAEDLQEEEEDLQQQFRQPQGQAIINLVKCNIRMREFSLNQVSKGQGQI